MRWESEDEGVLIPAGDVVLYVTDEEGLYDWELRFPASVIADVNRFDRLVNELALRSTDRKPHTPRVVIGGLLRNLGVAEADESAIEATYRILCDLYDEGRDHIWGFYIRNQSRPTWLSRPENRVDVLIGNPPWLAYRFMSEKLQGIYERRARERNLWVGGARGRSTQQDLSAYFVVRSIELYLKQNGRFGFVMPRAFLSRRTYEGFRAGRYSVIDDCNAAFATSWDMGMVRPNPFPVPCAVTFGSRSSSPRALPTVVRAWFGQAPSHGIDVGSLTSANVTISTVTDGGSKSPYTKYFRQGAILVPRMLIMVTDSPSTPLGVPQGRRAVQSRKTSLDKPPWKDLPSHEGVVESIFVCPAYLGESIAPFRILSCGEAVIPYDGTRLMDGDDERLDRYPGLAAWWRKAERIWMRYRSSEKRTLIQQLDYMKQLTAQYPIADWRVVYTASGGTLAAAVIHDRVGVIEHKLYWGPVSTPDEAQYLTAILNAPALTELVRPLQSVGLFGPRDFDKYVWRSPIPAFDPNKESHLRLVKLADDATAIARDVDLRDVKSFQSARRAIRKELISSGLTVALDDAITRLMQEY